MKENFNSDFWQLQKDNESRFKKLLFILFSVYTLLFYGLLKITLFIFSARFRTETDYSLFKGYRFFLLSAAVSLIITYFHYMNTMKKSENQIKNLLKKSGPDKDDLMHKQILNILEELKVSFGYSGKVHLIILPALSKNVFSLGINNNNNIIGITEGLIYKFSRQEIQALLAQQLTHIVNKDTFIMTFINSTYSLLHDMTEFKIFDKKEDFEIFGFNLLRTRKNRGSEFIVYYLLMLPFIYFARFIVKCMICVVSRNREYYADYKAVQATRDPMALAEGLYKIYNDKLNNSVFLELPVAPLYIVPSQHNTINEETGFFADLMATHPPFKERLSKLLGMTGLSVKNFIYEKNKEKYFSDKNNVETKIPDTEPKNKYYAYYENEWLGPFIKRELIELDFLMPETFINIAGTETVDHFNSIFPEYFINPDKVSGLCPRCRGIGGQLYESYYEYVPVKKCGRCRGVLIESDKIIRIINRNIEQFSFNAVQLADAHIKKIKKIKLTKKVNDFDDSNKLFCPVCNKEMNRVFYNYQHYIVVDRCIDCNLVWFDNGELEMLQYFIEKKY